MIGISFSGISRRQLKIGPTTGCLSAGHRQACPGLKTSSSYQKKRTPPTPIFGQRVSVNQLLSQPHIGLEPACASRHSSIVYGVRSIQLDYLRPLPCGPPPPFSPGLARRWSPTGKPVAESWARDPWPRPGLESKGRPHGRLLTNCLAN